MSTDRYPVLETDRLILRQWKESDAPALFAVAKDPLVGPSAGWLPHMNVGYSRAVIRTVFCSRTAFAVTVREGVKGRDGKLIPSGVPLGSVGLAQGPLLSRGIREDEAELGYSIGSSYWNNGFATEAALAVICYGFGNNNYRQIWCAHYDGNCRSSAVMRRLGFRFDHITEDSWNPMLHVARTEVFSVMTREDFEISRTADILNTDIRGSKK